MGKFGWSYPPGAATDPNAPYNQTPADALPVWCEVCGFKAETMAEVEEHDQPMGNFALEPPEALRGGV